MKNIRLISTFILIALTLIILPQVSAAKIYELKWADHFPPGNDMAILGEKFGEMVTERTNGQVKITFFHAETLSKAKEVIGALQAGVCDIITCVAPAFPGQFNMYLIPNVPGFGISNRKMGNEIRWRLFEQGYFSDLEPYKVLGFVDVGQQRVWLREKKITTVDDFKGMKIRGANAAYNAMFEKLGATPISLPGSEEYMSLSRKMIDGLTTGWENVIGNKLYEVLKYVVWNPLGDGNMVWLMNKGKWNDLPPDIKAAIDKIMPEFKDYLVEYFKKDEQADKLIKEKGVELITLSPEEYARLNKAGEGEIDKLIDKNEAEGRPARKMVEEIKRMVGESR